MGWTRPFCLTGGGCHGGGIKSIEKKDLFFRGGVYGMEVSKGLGMNEPPQ